MLFGRFRFKFYDWSIILGLEGLVIYHRVPLEEALSVFSSLGPVLQPVYEFMK